MVAVKGIYVCNTPGRPPRQWSVFAAWRISSCLAHLFPLAGLLAKGGRVMYVGPVADRISMYGRLRHNLALRDRKTHAFALHGVPREKATSIKMLSLVGQGVTTAKRVCAVL